MSHRPRPNQGPVPGLNDVERRRIAICCELGFNYPPNHDVVYGYLLRMKAEAEACLKDLQLGQACAMYTRCLDAARLFPPGAPVADEQHRMLCNRSLVLTKMRRFREAKDDAENAMMLEPDFLKAYWRVSQAVRGGHDGVVKALPYILAGLQKALEGRGTTPQQQQQDVIAFLAELCTLIPMTLAAEFDVYGYTGYTLRTDLAMIVPSLDHEVWVKVLQKLCSTNTWYSVAMLVTGDHGGPPSVLDGIAGRVPCGGVSVGTLLASATPDHLRKWAENLAVKLLQLGASVDEIGLKMNKPPVHVATEIALTTKRTILLKSILDHYKNDPDKKNAQNSVGSTALHLLVRSKQASRPHGLATLQLLLGYQLSTMTEDNNKKIPLQYLSITEEAYRVLKKATKSVDELRQDLEVLKGRGNDALKAGKLDDALRHYGKGLDISQQSKQLYKEAAILYSNRANVYYKQRNYEEALTNCLAAIRCDSSYHKGHWWNGKVCFVMGSYDEAFMAYIDGCTKASISPEVQLSFVMEAVTLLKLIPGDKFMTCYSQLHFVNFDLWPQALSRLSKSAEWKVMAFLLFGPDLDEKKFPEGLYYGDMDLLFSGVAKSAPLRDVTMSTVFQYLRENNVRQCLHWLDALVLAVFERGIPDAFQTMATDDRDTPLHAAIRYSLITGSLSLLNELPVDDFSESHLYEDGWGNSVFHTVAKMRPLPPAQHVEDVMQFLLDRGFSAMDRDRSRKLAVEYLDSSYPGYLFDMFFKASGSNTLGDINHLKQEGNVYFKGGQYADAVLAYSKAISLLERHSPHAVAQGLTSRDIAMLYGNRAEAYIKTDQCQQALEDAKKSVSVDGHWYKGHLRVGKALRGLWDYESAMRAFINAYKDTDSQEDSIKVEILLELCEVCTHLTHRFDLKKKLPEFPQGEGHLWARAAYKLVGDNKWDVAHVAYQQYSATGARRKTFDVTLKPVCNLKKLRTYSWGAGLLQYLLECKANPNTLSLEPGDTYLHAVVRIELTAGGKSIKLLEYVLRVFCVGTNRDQHRQDTGGNTVLHTATAEAGSNVSPDQRYKIVILLLKHDVDPNIKNRYGKLALEYLPMSETQCREHLRMAMYGKENMPKTAAPTRILQRPSPSPTRQTPSPKVPDLWELKGCEVCDDLYRQATICLSKEEVRDGYIKLGDILTQPHKASRHDKVVKNTIEVFVDKLGESANPEIPNALTDIPVTYYRQIIGGLAKAGKWRQLDAVVRKYRAVKGSDQLKGFASSLSLVPVVKDSSLRGAEDVKLQIIGNLLNSGATFGRDRGVEAIESAQEEDHYKVVTRLVREGASTTCLSMTYSDTPIHAALTIVLEKEKVPALLEFLLDQYQCDPVRFGHLDPEQQDRNGDCLFHVIARVKYNNTVLRVTELLCNRNLSAHYYNKEGKLPVHYITRKQDRRLQFLRLAGAVKPRREQMFSARSPSKGDKSGLDDEDLQQFMRGNESEAKHEVTEVNRALSVFETRRRTISDLIRLLPDSRVSIFRANVANKQTQPKAQTQEPADDDRRQADGAGGKRPKLMHKSDLDKENCGKTAEDEAENGNNNQYGDDETEEEQTSQADTSAEFVDAVESLDDLTKDVLDSIDDLPMDSDEKKTDVDTKEDTVAKAVNLGGNGDKLSERVTETIGNILTVFAGRSPQMEDMETVESGKEGKTETADQNDKQKKDKQEVLAETQGDVKQETTDDGETDVEVIGGVQNLPEEGKKVEEAGRDRDNAEREGNAEVQVEDDSESEEEFEEEEEEFIIDAQVFDNLEWEVECTAEVWKTLRDKHVLHELKRRIVHKIQLLATGDWQPHLCKRLRNVPQNLKLYEAKFSKGSRILWELAIAFSPRLSEAAESRLQTEKREGPQAVRGGRIYSEIIRVWEIVLDHDKIHRTVEKIKRSHDRGEKCIIQKNLKGIRDEAGAMSFTERRYPRLYAEGEETQEDLQRYKKELQRYFPPASANDTEYHILKFYSFSSMLVSHVLHNVEAKVDFPFRVTDLEHAIITLHSKAPILLLGRSGTGKTTCCLYRLWSQFHTYWATAKKAEAPLMPRGVEFLFQEVDGDDSEEESTEDEGSSGRGSPDQQEEEPSGACGRSTPGVADGDDDHDPQQEDVADGNNGNNECDHLHQVFITKNSVLCSEVQKNFRELSHADELMADHVLHEEENLPARLHEVGDLAYPMFVTSRQLLLMLDASIGAPYFFDRKEDGSLKVDIVGWSDLDGPLALLPLLDADSDDEEDGDQFVAEDDDDFDDGDARHGAAAKKKKVDPRREITYAVFAEEIWPKIKKSMSESYHPSLIWTEIMSFIKGSYEALTKPSGHLQLEEYEKLGRKRAPNFSGQRDVIFTCFKRYEHFKKQNSLFDETDLVHDVFCRLRQLKTRPWVIHQIFVDETQDFTQAELCLLIRLCQNPNDMFLTGDTAQSIMRGIAFRFSDLRSLFYHAKQSMQAMGKTSAVEVPKQVYQLTHNYRSHAGILSLASSILELMVEFFPESFDRLQPDQGLFTGPQPILLESCSFSDLAVLLRGNKRKTSHIEFGAHQAILVVSEAARDAIPEELRLGLVLTIYEAKGLEFDDVLLYNFFKDSQAGKEWRVVTEYLERLAAQNKDTRSANPGQEDSLVVIDEDLLYDKLGKPQSGRPRPLDFDPNQHKVLNSELKHLYTALTRARVNVWIFDESKENRAPMFEFFKARKLVKSLTVSEINEESLSETVFAEKSSCSDWVRRGEDFMKHHLYRVAAKCFGMGLDTDREKVALAHHQALLASRSKDHPRKMREEFLLAAEMYLACNKPAKAAVCLQNAREKELAAGLFEKLGQFERAADMYRRLKQPIASSRCYEQLGNFNKAIEVLYENESYNLALDTLRRYQMILQELQQRGAGIPHQLTDNRPAQHYTEEKLSHRAAEMYHRYQARERMLEAVERFPNVEDQVKFLERREYVTEAADVLQKQGELGTAAGLLLKYGKLDEALLAARNTLDEAVIAHHLLAFCRVLVARQRKGKLGINNSKHLLEMVKEAIQLFQTCNNNDGFGAARLIQAELGETESAGTESVRQAWKAFKGSSPVHNEAGLMDCADWLVAHGNLENGAVLRHVLESVGYGFSLCHVLLDAIPATAGVERIKKMDQYLGLLPCSTDSLAVHPLEKPLCLQILKDMFKNKNHRRQTFVEVKTRDLREAVVAFLLRRMLGWVDRVSEAMDRSRDKVRVCSLYQAGLECPDEGNIDRPCLCLHKPHTKATWKKLIEIDVSFIEMEDSLQAASSLKKKKLPPNILQLVNGFVEEGERDLSVKFHACRQLWNDLMPSFGHPALIDEESKELVEYLRRDNVKSHFRHYLLDKWADALKEQKGSGTEKKLKCKAVRETEVFLLFEFGYHLFGLDQGKIKMHLSPVEEMTSLENALDREVKKKGAWDIQRTKRFYSLMFHDGKKGVFVKCIAKRFTDAYGLISKRSDPYEAVFQFNKFMYVLDERADVSFLPELKHYLFWIEFYTVLATLTIAKLKSKDFQDFVFVLPSSYLNLLKFVEATLPGRSLPIIDGIEYWKPDYHTYNPDARLQERLKFYAFCVSGHGHSIKLMQEALKFSLNDPADYCLVERLFILSMTLVCNIGKAVPVPCEISLMGTMSRVQIPPEGPQRLAEVVTMIRKSRGIADVAATLKWLIEKRGNGDEALLVSRWVSSRRQKIESNPLRDVVLFSPEFLNPKTITNMQSKVPELPEARIEEPLMEHDLTEEEINKGHADKQAEKNRQKAALIITGFFRQIQDFKRKLKKPAEEKTVVSEIDKQFLAIKVDDNWCGICGVSFKQKVQEDIQLEKSVLVGGERSVMNDPFVAPASPESSGAEPVSPHAFSPEQTKQPFKWGKPQKQAFEDPEFIRKRLQVRQNHVKEGSHLEKCIDLNRFRNKYREDIVPKLKNFTSFLKNPDFNLEDREHREKNYDRHLLEVDRMFDKYAMIQREIQMLIKSRMWSNWGLIHQNIKEVETDMNIVVPYVIGVHAHLKKEEEEQRLASASASGTSLAGGEVWDEDEDDIEEVVAEPHVPTRQSRRTRKNRHRRKRE